MSQLESVFYEFKMKNFVNPSVSVSVHCTDLCLFTCCWPWCIMPSWVHSRAL